MQIKKSFIAKRSLGQNFLRDPKILKKIADFAQIGKEDTVVEVGPGDGTLTELLLERVGKVIAIEKDGKLAGFLKEKFKNEISNNKLEIINEDILNYELRIKNYALVGNIPYYITGALFKKFLESENPPKSITFVVQKEVAERIMGGSHFAKASRDKKESILSISIKAYGRPEYGGIIKAGSFYPKPKVDSAIIAVRNINKVKFAAQQKSFSSESPRTPSLRSARLSSENFFAERMLEQKFFGLLKMGFAHKRKLLIKNLGANKDIFEKCGIPEKARAENLKVEGWICLTKELV
jgi:16S rRNA (adenine1518-N6/adenine1519-N6)-dimethyltransferase